MSIDPRKDRKNYEITIKGTRTDLDGLSDVLATAIKRMDVDIYPDDKDIPGRISLTKGTAFQFSRVKRGIKELSEGLKSEDKNVSINLGDIDLKEGRPNEPKEEWLAMMDAVTDGRRAGAIKTVGNPIHDLMKRERIFTDQEYAERGQGSPELLTEANMRWMYAESLIGPEATAKQYNIQSMRGAGAIDDYPPKLNKEAKGRLKRWAKKHDFNRAYIVVLEVDRWFDINMPVHTKPGKWDDTIKELAAGGAILSNYEGKKPRTVGDLYVRIAAYASGRTFDMKDVVVVPFDISQMGKFPLVGEKDGEKIYLKKGVVSTRTSASGEKYPDYRNFMAFLVVGRGSYKPLGLTRVPEDLGDDIDFPNF